MKKLRHFALAVSLVPLVSFMTAGLSESAETAACTKNDDCDDDNPCTKDKCDQDTGQCEFRPHDFGNHNGHPIGCDDGNACTSADVCHAGVCAGVNVPDGTACDDTDTCSGPDTCQGGVCGLNGEPVSTIAFTSGRDNSTGNPQLTAEIYLMNGDGTNSVRLTANADGDAFATLSPDGKGRIVFDSNRSRAPGEPLNTSDLFLMKVDGTHQTFLTRGSSATWSSDSQSIAFHRSATGTGLPIRGDPGAPTSDSDIFAARVCDLVAHVPPTNITNTTMEIEEDADWSPDGQKIVFMRRHVGTNLSSSEVYVLNLDGTEEVKLTDNEDEERAPTWSPNGTRIAYMCRHGGADFEICVMNADGTGQAQLTDNTVFDATPSWSPDGQKIAFHRLVAGLQQIFVMNAVLNADGTVPTADQVTGPPGMNLFANWGEVKVGP